MTTKPKRKPAKTKAKSTTVKPTVVIAPNPPSIRQTVRNLFNQNVASLPLKEGGVGAFSLTAVKKLDGNFAWQLHHEGISREELVFILEYLRLQQFNS